MTQLRLLSSNSCNAQPGQTKPTYETRRNKSNCPSAQIVHVRFTYYILVVTHKLLNCLHFTKLNQIAFTNSQAQIETSYFSCLHPSPFLSGTLFGRCPGPLKHLDFLFVQNGGTVVYSCLQRIRFFGVCTKRRSEFQGPPSQRRWRVGWDSSHKWFLGRDTKKPQLQPAAISHEVPWTIHPWWFCPSESMYLDTKGGSQNITKKKEESLHDV